MTVVRHLIAVADFLAAPGSGAEGGLGVEEVLPPAADGEIASLIDACRTHGGGMASRLSARGMIAELAGREGRRHRVWIAREAGCGAVGLIVLTETLPGPRFSISWLIVHPAWRRRGVGKRLVHEVVTAVRGADGRTLHVETLDAWADAKAFWARFA